DRQFDIRPEADFNSVPCFGRPALLHTNKLADTSRRYGVLTILGQRGCTWMQDHFTFKRIDNDLVAGSCVLVKIIQTNYRRNAEGASHDRRVRGPAARIRRYRARVLQIELSDCRGQQVFGDDHLVLGALLYLSPFAAEGHEYTMQDVFDI